MSLISKLKTLGESHLDAPLFPENLSESMVAGMMKVVFEKKEISAWRKTTLDLLTKYEVKIKTTEDEFFNAFQPILNDVLSKKKLSFLRRKNG